LEGIDEGLIGAGIGGDDEGPGGVAGEAANAGEPVFEFVKGVEVVAGGGPGAAVETDYGEAGGQQGRGRGGAEGMGLIDVDKGEVVVDQGAARFFAQPAIMAEFGGEREFAEGAAEFDEEGAVFDGESERPGELKDQGAETPGAEQREETGFPGGDGSGIEEAVVGEAAAEKGREEEAGIGGRFAGVKGCDFRFEWLVESGRDLREAGEGDEGVERVGAARSGGGRNRCESGADVEGFGKRHGSHFALSSIPE
jgi:hypothetical protein